MTGRFEGRESTREGGRSLEGSSLPCRPGDNIDLGRISSLRLGDNEGWGSAAEGRNDNEDDDRRDEGRRWEPRTGQGEEDSGRSRGVSNEHQRREETDGRERRDEQGRRESSVEAKSRLSEEATSLVDGLVKTLQNVDVKLADKQADVNSPLYSIKTFEELGLSEDLLKGIYSMKFTKPSKVQERALPLLLRDPPQNMIAQSQSGTGKTAAFVLTMLKRVDPDLDATQAVCLAPTRELARQILDVVQQMGQYTQVTSALCLREEAPRRQAVASHIIVGTRLQSSSIILTMFASLFGRNPRNIVRTGEKTIGQL